MRLKRRFFIFFLIVIPLLGSLFSGCMGPKGEVYLAYSWVSAPEYIYDENPSIPATINNGTYYESSEGSYYMEYVAWDGRGWWMNYTLSANPGALFLMEGDPAYFEISLYSFGPSIYQWSEPRSGEEAAGDRPDHGSQSIIRGGYTLSIEYGRL